MVRDRDGWLRPPDDPTDFLRLAPEIQDEFDLDFVPLLNKDSTNITPNDWKLIAEAIYQRRQCGYEGFVVVHGTDTMHYSASAVALALGPGVPFPVVFTGAQTASHVTHGDARINLIRACKVATQDLAEVVIVFDDYVLRGCRAEKKERRRFDAFESPGLYPLGLIAEEITISPTAMNRESKKALRDFELKPRFAEGVIHVSLIPGLEPELLAAALDRSRCKGLVLGSFGGGNVPDEGEFSLNKTIEMAISMHKPVVLTSQFRSGSAAASIYRPGIRAIQAGAIPTAGMTASCAVTKLRWAIALAENEGISGTDRVDHVREIMSNVFVGEMDSPIAV